MEIHRPTRAKKFASTNFLKEFTECTDTLAYKFHYFRILSYYIRAYVGIIKLAREKTPKHFRDAVNCKFASQ